MLELAENSFRAGSAWYAIRKARVEKHPRAIARRTPAPSVSHGSDAGHRRPGQRSPPDARAGRFVRWLATALFALALPIGAVLPSAAQADVLLSNLDEGNRSTATVGSSAGSRFTQAIGFETGSNTGGYTLTSIRAALSNALPADGVRVHLYGAQFGSPDSRLFTFDNPTVSDGTKEFTAPANTTLQKNRLYFLVFDSSVTNAGYRVGTTDSNSLTSAVAGWKLNASLHFRVGTDGTWLVNPNDVALRVEINGTVVPNATGQPGITGVPQAGQSLTATVGDITDADGLPAFPSGFTFQWVRVNGTTETDIPGATSSTYEPVEADVGKQIKVKVSYTDNAGASEGPLESDPTDDAVLAARGPCSPRSDWCAGTTVRHGTGTSVPLELGVGTDGALDDNSFEPQDVRRGVPHPHREARRPRPATAALNPAQAVPDAAHQGRGCPRAAGKDGDRRDDPARGRPGRALREHPDGDGQTGPRGHRRTALLCVWRMAGQPTSVRFRARIPGHVSPPPHFGQPTTARLRSE